MIRPLLGGSYGPSEPGAAHQRNTFNQTQFFHSKNYVIRVIIPWDALPVPSSMD